MTLSIATLMTSFFGPRFRLVAVFGFSRIPTDAATIGMSSRKKSPYPPLARTREASSKAHQLRCRRRRRFGDQALVGFAYQALDGRSYPASTPLSLSLTTCSPSCTKLRSRSPRMNSRSCSVRRSRTGSPTATSVAETCGCRHHFGAFTPVGPWLAQRFTRSNLTDSAASAY